MVIYQFRMDNLGIWKDVNQKIYMENVRHYPNGYFRIVQVVG